MLVTLAQTLILAAESEEGGDGLDLLLPATEELIAGIIAFLIIFLVVRQFALPALTETLDRRQAAIKGELAAAEEQKAEAAQLLADYQQQVAGAREEANRIIEDARKDAESVRADVTDRANAEAQEILDKARSEAGVEKARALAEAQSEVKNISIDIAEKVVGANLDRNAQDGLIESFLADLDRMGN